MDNDSFKNSRIQSIELLQKKKKKRKEHNTLL